MGLDLVLRQQHKVSAFSCDALECPWTENEKRMYDICTHVRHQANVPKDIVYSLYCLLQVITYTMQFLLVVFPIQLGSFGFKELHKL